MLIKIKELESRNNSLIVSYAEVREMTNKLEKKMETLFWAILCGLGALSLALITIFLAK